MATLCHYTIVAAIIHIIFIWIEVSFPFALHLFVFSAPSILPFIQSRTIKPFTVSLNKRKHGALYFQQLIYRTNFYTIRMENECSDICNAMKWVEIARLESKRPRLHRQLELENIDSLHIFLLSTIHSNHILAFTLTLTLLLCLLLRVWLSLHCQCTSAHLFTILSVWWRWWWW